MSSSSSTQTTVTLNAEQLDAIMETLGTGAVFPIRCTGTSMTPTFRHGQTLLYLQIGKPDRIRTGDVLFFKRKEGQPILHRVRKIRKDGRLVMNGDAQNWTEVINPGQVTAKLVRFQRKGEKDKVTEVSALLYRLWVCCWSLTFRFRPFLFRVVRVARR